MEVGDGNIQQLVHVATVRHEAMTRGRHHARPCRRIAMRAIDCATKSKSEMSFHEAGRGVGETMRREEERKGEKRREKDRRGEERRRKRLIHSRSARMQELRQMKLHLDTPKLEQEREGRPRQKSKKREKYMVALSRPTCARVPAPTRYG